MQYTFHSLPALLHQHSDAHPEHDCALYCQAGLDEDKFVPEKGTYIASSYVKFVESGGARVVPILADTPADVVGPVGVTNRPADTKCQSQGSHN